MKISITPPAGNPVVLCDHTDAGPAGFTCVPVRKMDVLEFVQGRYARSKSRGNVLNQITFSVTRQHADYAAAEKYILLLNDNYPDAGDLIIELSDRITRCIARGATLEISAAPPIGISTTTTYIIKCGKIIGAEQVFAAEGNAIKTSDGGSVFVNKP